MAIISGAAVKGPSMILVSYWSNFDQKMLIQEKNKIIFPEKQALNRGKSEKTEKIFVLEKSCCPYKSHEF